MRRFARLVVVLLVFALTALVGASGVRADAGDQQPTENLRVRESGALSGMTQAMLR